MDQELSSTRSELDKVVRANRAAASSSARQTPTQPSPANYYSFANTSVNTGQTPTYTPYYNSYTYPYGQSSAYMFPLHSGLSTPTAPYASHYSVSQLPKPSLTQPHNPQSQNISSANQKQDPSNPSPQLPAQAKTNSAAIPLQIPVTSLPALQALGILPVPKAVLPPPNEPQPPAVLVGTTNNGTMLSLEINATLLQTAQMNGLAILLSGLVQMTEGKGGNAPTQTSTPQVANGSGTTVTEGSEKEVSDSATAK